MTLTTAQRAHLKRRLEEEQARILSTLNRFVAERSDGTAEERSGDVASIPTHAADLGTDVMQQELDASNDTRMSRELMEIEDALERLRQSPDTFGIAEDTGAPIPFERLDIIPWARTAVGVNSVPVADRE
jgi:RNA polymerase-binding transcription factor